MSKVDLSAIVIVHDEGIIAHKTMLSVFRSLHNFEKAGHSWELIVHIDKGSKETKQYFKRYEEDERIKILQNNFGDPGMSRNFSSAKAKGDFCAFLDGDDLISSNWYLEAFNLAAKTKQPILVHPEANLTFGIHSPNILWIAKNSFEKNKDAAILAGTNRWPSVVLGRKIIFEQYKYPKTENGYGHEDWHFNTETTAGGIEHRVALSTIEFYRKKRDSVLVTNTAQNNIQPFSKLLDLEFLKKITIKEDIQPKFNFARYKNGFKKIAKQVYKDARDIRALNFFITPVAEIGKKTIIGKNLIGDRESRLPKFLAKACEDISEIEPQIYPTQNFLRNILIYDSESCSIVGDKLIKLSKNFTKTPDYVFIVPWLVFGGADKVVINYIKSIKRIKPEWTIAVVTTLPAKNTWQEKLPDNTFLIDFGNETKNLDYFFKDAIFSRLITQLKCKKIHIVNSEFAYLWAGKHKTLIKNNYSLRLSYFCFEYIANTNKKGIFDYADPYIVDIFDVVDAIFTDNKAIIDRAVKRCGFEPSKFKVHYQPIEMNAIEKTYEIKKPVRILWASRIANQKNPELLLRIARKINNKKMKIDVYGSFENNFSKKMFEKIDTIEYMGGFDGADSLPTEKYDIFLYTSTIDGIPNILLEMISKGMPIVASKVGGVEEVIDKKSGRLINNTECEDDYISAIEDLAKNLDSLSYSIKQQQRFLSKRHSFDAFDKKVLEDIIEQ